MQKKAGKGIIHVPPSTKAQYLPPPRALHNAVHDAGEIQRKDENISKETHKS